MSLTISFVPLCSYLKGYRRDFISWKPFYIAHVDTDGNIFTFLSLLQNSGGRSGLSHGFSWFVSCSEVVSHDIMWAISLVLSTAWVMNKFADNFYF